MKKLLSKQEEDFQLLKSVSLGRLSPDGISVFFWGALVFAAVATGVSLFGLSESAPIISPFLDSILSASKILLGIQFVITLFFTFERNAFRFQRLQTFLLSCISLKLSVDMYPFFFTLAITKAAPQYVMNAGFFLLIGGIIYMVISTARGIKRVEKGEFRKGGRGLYQFKHSKAYISLPFIYGATMLGGTVARNFSDSGGLDSLFALLLCVVIQYGIALAWPEFFLLTYTKLRFKSFIVNTPDRLRKKEK